MGPEEFYLGFIDGKMSRRYLPFCPFELPAATVMQSIFMIAMIYKTALMLEETLIEAGHKMNEDAILAFRQQIGLCHFEIMTFKWGIEN